MAARFETIDPFVRAITIRGRQQPLATVQGERLLFRTVGELPVALQTQSSYVSVGSEAVHFAVAAGDVIKFTGESSGAASANVALGGHLEPARKADERRRALRLAATRALNRIRERRL